MTWFPFLYGKNGKKHKKTWFSGWEKMVIKNSQFWRENDIYQAHIVYCMQKWCDLPTTICMPSRRIFLGPILPKALYQRTILGHPKICCVIVCLEIIYKSAPLQNDQRLTDVLINRSKSFPIMVREFRCTNRYKKLQSIASNSKLSWKSFNFTRFVPCLSCSPTLAIQLWPTEKQIRHSY